jgi:polygalacturonase
MTAPDWVDVRTYGAVGDGVTDNSTAFAAAVASGIGLTGGVVYVPSGTYVINSPWVISKNHLTIHLDSGAHLRKLAHSSAIVVSGTELGITGVLASDPAANSTTLTLSGNDASAFILDQWIVLRDQAVSLHDIPAAIHMEINRIRSISALSGTLSLYYPTRQPYATVAGIAPSVFAIAPVEAFALEGHGRLENATLTLSGGHGVFLRYATNARIQGVEFFNVLDSCVHAERCTGVLLESIVMRDAPAASAPTGTPRGYGFTTFSSWDVKVANGQFMRLRHGIDFSVFARKCVAVGNAAWGAFISPFNTHETVEDVAFVGNIIDGGVGVDDSGAEWGTSAGGHGINIDRENRRILVANNTIRNTRLAGVHVDTFGTEHVSIVDNFLENTNIANNSGYGGITCLQTSGTTTAYKGYVIARNQLVRCVRFGIRIGISDAVVADNLITDTTSPSDIGIGILLQPGSSMGATVSGVVVRGNHVSGSDQDGIRVGLTTSGALTVHSNLDGNTVLLNRQHGIHLARIIHEVGDEKASVC